MSKEFNRRFQYLLMLGEQKYLRREARLFGVKLCFSEYAHTQISKYRNKRFITAPARIMNKLERKKFLFYCSYSFPIRFSVEPLSVSFIDSDGFEQILIDFDLFEAIYRVDENISRIKLLKIKAAVEEAYDGNWAETLKQLLKWPRTDTPLGLEDFFPEGWQSSGLLSILGYSVGIKGKSELIRREILSSIVKQDVIPKHLREDYRRKWGDPNSLTRLLKLARTIAALCRNAKASPNNYSKAILDWESDLAFLKNSYFYDFLNLNKEEWPST